MQETWVSSLGWEDPLKKGMATHSSILAQRIPQTESLVGYSPWGHKELDMTEQLSTYMCVTASTHRLQWDLNGLVMRSDALAGILKLGVLGIKEEVQLL